MVRLADRYGIDSQSPYPGIRLGQRLHHTLIGHPVNYKDGESIDQV